MKKLIICRSCGAENEDGVTFCEECGILLDETPVTETYTVPPFPQPPSPPPCQRIRYGRIAGSIIGVIVIIIVIYLLLFTPLGKNLWARLTRLGPAIGMVPERTDFTLKREISVTSNNNIEYTIDLPQPASFSVTGTELQRVNSVTFSQSPTRTETRYGNTWMIWKDRLGPSKPAVVLSITFSVTAKTYTWKIDSSNSGTVSDIPEKLKTKYLTQEWLDNESGNYRIDPQNNEIRRLALQLTADKTTVYEKARAIYEYMVENFRYKSHSGEPQPALTTLRLKSGDCDDQTFLLASFLRACEIPAWGMFGALYDMGRNEWVGHTWCRVAVPLRGGGCENVVIDVVNKEFFSYIANSFVEWEDDGNGTHLKDFYNYLEVSYSGHAVYTSSENYIAVSYTPQGSTTTPGFETAVLVGPTIFIAGLACWHCRKRRNSLTK